MSGVNYAFNGEYICKHEMIVISPSRKWCFNFLFGFNLFYLVYNNFSENESAKVFAIPSFEVMFCFIYSDVPKSWMLILH